jgi:hypothetical protein
MTDFYQPPGGEISPGDVFVGLPFSLLRFPLAYFRLRRKLTEDTAIAELLTPDKAPPKEGDSPKTTLLPRSAMLLSHGCEVEKLLNKQSLDRRYWLAAPIEPFARCKPETQQRIRESRQPNKFYLPRGEYIGTEENFVDLRRIAPINIPYFQQAEKLCSLTEPARLALQSHLGVFFSGLALYVQPIECPQCGHDIDPKRFLVETIEDENED